MTEDNQYNSFRKSAENFIKFFSAYREKRIVLYGLGQYTATLISMAPDFNFVGLMDGDASNIGREMYGLRVISIAEAKKADLIVINTSTFYWDLIYERISDIGIPVYFPNGSLAKKINKKKNKISNVENISEREIKEAISNVDIVSFDFYGTLFMRKVCNSIDVFKIIEMQIEYRNGKRIPFQEMRNKAIGALQKEDYTLDDIYGKMYEIYPSENIQLFKEIELKTERAVTTGRNDMLCILKYAQENNKEVYILSDMYLPTTFFIDLLADKGIKMEKDHVWISGEKGVSKNNKKMWRSYLDRVVGKRKALHIGDSMQADILSAKEVGIEAVKVASAEEMMEEIVPLQIRSHMHSLYSSITNGIIMDELFNSPFAWNYMDDRFCINTCRKFGRVVFGNVVLTYLLWLLEESKKRGIKKLVFLSRDGYFLRQDYLNLINRLHITSAPETEYLLISRKLILTYACGGGEESAFEKLLNFSYFGKFRDYLYDRFDIVINIEDRHAEEVCQLPQDKDKVYDWILPYRDTIYEQINQQFKIYEEYIKEFDWDRETAVVDICYTGTIQYWLSKALDKGVTGFYCVANISDDNPYKANNTMAVCFQETDDLLADRSEIWKYHKIVESFLTAPYGMVKAVNTTGEFTTYNAGNNQKYFMERELINTGCNEFVMKYISLLRELDMIEIPIDSVHVDKMFGNWFKTRIAFSSTVKKCFWHEDGFINTGREYSLF